MARVFDAGFIDKVIFGSFRRVDNYVLRNTVEIGYMELMRGYIRGYEILRKLRMTMVVGGVCRARTKVGNYGMATILPSPGQAPLASIAETFRNSL
jgi:hypothetical protein